MMNNFKKGDIVIFKNEKNLSKATQYIVVEVNGDNITISDKGKKQLVVDACELRLYEEARAECEKTFRSTLYG